MATAGKWDDLQGVKLHRSILATLENDFGFNTMTPVQAAAIPPILNCKDVCVEAETGSGKTLSFLLPIAQLLLYGRSSSSSSQSGPLSPEITKNTKQVRAIIILPTRELALQVHSVAERLFNGLDGGVKPVPLVGGSVGNAGPDEEHANDCRVVIGTPGRLGAALCGGYLNICDSFDILVMDEGDRLLDMGFSVTLTDILVRLPKQRRTGLYSATQTKEVEALARAGMRNPVRVVVKVHRKEEDNSMASTSRARIPTSVHCYYQIASPRDKLASLMHLLSSNQSHKFIVYCLTCACVEYLRKLPLDKILEQFAKTKERRKFYCLHGKMTQKKRQFQLSQFTNSTNGVLLCTDVAARGIDISDVEWVVQLDIPQDPDSYIHRVGRTGRLGRQGQAMIFLSPWENNYIDFLKIRKCHIQPYQQPAEADEKGKISEIVNNLTHKAIIEDRGVLESSEKAFLSFVRAYKEHRCNVLLKVEDIDFNSLADAFGLLRIPKFYEFKKVRGSIEPRNVTGIVIRDIKFKDKVKESKRQEEIRKAIENRSERKEALQAKSKKKKKKKRKRDNNDDDDDDDVNVDVGGGGGEDNEEEDFSMEAMQLRKLKKGKLTHEQFDKLAGYEDL